MDRKSNIQCMEERNNRYKQDIADFISVMLRLSTKRKEIYERGNYWFHTYLVNEYLVSRYFYADKYY